jgi:hypothetical protein
LSSHAAGHHCPPHRRRGKGPACNYPVVCCLSELKDHTGHGTSTVVELKGKRKLKANVTVKLKEMEKIYIITM